MENKQDRKEENQNKKGVAYKVGDAIEKLGDKVEHNISKKAGDAIEKLGDKIEHSGDRKRQ